MKLRLFGCALTGLFDAVLVKRSTMSWRPASGGGGGGGVCVVVEMALWCALVTFSLSK